MTVRQSPEAALGALSSHALHSLLDSFPDPTLLLAPDRRVLSVNRAFQTLYGDGDSAVGRRCYEVLHQQRTPCSANGEECPLVGTGDIGQPAQSLHVHHGAHGEEHHHVRILPLGPPGRDPEAYLEILRRCETASVTPSPDRLSGRAPSFNRMLGVVYRVAATRMPALVRGEPGTGKARVARAIHALGDRRSGPFVAVSCSGLDTDLLEREIFGHGRAPSTVEAPSAPSAIGAVGTARGGTLFLDEVGDLPPLLQVKLLRLVDRGTYQPADGAETLRADVRLVCSSHLDLAARARDGTFRADLYHRIAAFPVDVPPLRERREDLEILIGSLLPAIVGDRPVTLHPETLAILAAHPFPGNLHELRHLLERACLLADGDTILPRHLPAECQTAEGLTAAAPPPGQDDLAERACPDCPPRPAPPPPADRVTPAAGTPPQEPVPGAASGDEILPLAEVSTRYLEWAAATFHGDNATLAKKLGVGERTLYRRLSQIRNGDRHRH